MPKAIGAREPQLLKYRVETIEVDGKLDDGTTFTYWTFAGNVPGPMLRVRQGDTVELELANAKNSKAIHTIDLHAVTAATAAASIPKCSGSVEDGSLQGAEPGRLRLSLRHPAVPHHIATGMYGLIVVEPPEGLPPVDREFYVMQGDFYLEGDAAGAKGLHEFALEAT